MALGEKAAALPSKNAGDILVLPAAFLLITVPITSFQATAFSQLSQCVAGL